MSELLILSAEAAMRHASRAVALEAARESLISIAQGRAEVFQVAAGRGVPHDSAVTVKSGLDPESGTLGLKVGTYFPTNRTYGLPNHGATTILLDAITGMPHALINARSLNAVRTAAADAAAAAALSKTGARNLTVLGTGHQSAFDIRAICDVRPIERIVLWNRTPAKAIQLRDSLRVERREKISVEADVAAAVAEADIIVTTSASCAPILFQDWLKPGTHVSAMGADRRGKHELDVEIITRSRLFADYPSQSLEMGELQHAFSAGLIVEEDVTPLGDVLAGNASGRLTEEEITVFDSSGIAMQDLSIASAVLARALRINDVVSVEFG